MYPGCSSGQLGGDSRRDSQDCGTGRNSALASAGLQEIGSVGLLLGKQIGLCRGISAQQPTGTNHSALSLSH